MTVMPFDVANGITAYAVGLSGYLVPAEKAFVNEPIGDWEDFKEITLSPSAILKLAQALNPLIKVTPKLLEAMEKAIGAKFLGVEPCDSLIPFSVCTDEEYPFDFDSHFTGKDYLKNRFTHIKADFPLALQVLLGFTVEGV